MLGSIVLRDYYVIVDNQFARIGFSSRKGSICDPQSSDNLIQLNDSNTFRLVLNSSYLVLIIIVTVKVSGGCL